MTSASELFYSRRYRFGRTDTDLGFDSDPPDRHLQYPRRPHGHNSNHRRDFNACDVLRRSSMHERHQSPRFSHTLVLDHSAAQSDLGTSQASRNNTNANIRNNTERIGLSRNSRLPGAVLLARERLLERLRGAPPSPSSRNGSSLVEVLDGAEILTRQSPRSSIDDASSRVERLQLVQLSKRPLGLSQEAIDGLQLDVFMNTQHITGDEVMMKESCDCSICLESFLDGDKLIHLPCEHKFHYACLDPWIRTCGDCPYCRQHIVVN